MINKETNKPDNLINVQSINQYTNFIHIDRIKDGCSDDNYNKERSLNRKGFYTNSQLPIQYECRS